MKSLKTARNKADKVFSQYIRLRDTAGEPRGGYCISCNKWFPYEKLDAGHYVIRRVLSLRFDVCNVHAQCRFCNRFNEGNHLGFTEGLKKIYGDEIFKYFGACINKHVKYSVLDLQIIAQQFQEKIDALKVSK